MTMAPTGRATSLAQRVAAEVRAEMSRQLLPQKELARRLDVVDMWLSRRLRGHVAFNLDELERVAQALGLSVTELLRRAEEVTVRQPAILHPVGFPADRLRVVGQRRATRLSMPVICPPRAA